MNGFAPFSIFFVYLVLFFLAMGGWIANIIKMIEIISDPVTGILVLRAIGIFFTPLGVVMEYL